MKVHEIVEGYNVPGTGGGTGGSSNSTVSATPAPQQQQNTQSKPAQNKPAQVAPQQGNILKTKDGKEIDLSDDDVNVELHADGTVDVYRDGELEESRRGPARR